MKCNYDEYFIQKYNDGLLSEEDKTEFERHLDNCISCKSIVFRDQAFLEYIKENTDINDIPLAGIISNIDHNKYKKKWGWFGFGTISIIKKSIPVLGIVLMVVILMNFSWGNRIGKLITGMLERSEKIDKNRVSIEVPIEDPNKVIQKSGMTEIPLEKLDNKNLEIKDKKLVEELNENGVGVTPWKVIYGSSKSIFLRNYSTLVKFRDGHIYKAADLSDMGLDCVQGSTISKFKFNAQGTSVIMGNENHDDDVDFKGKIYILDTDSGIYSVIDKGNLKNIAGNWSLNGQYYVFVNKNSKDNIRFYDTYTKKLYEIDTTINNIEEIFVSDKGRISFYSEGKVYFLDESTYSVEKVWDVDFVPLYINQEGGFIIALDNDRIKKYEYNEKGEFKIAVDIIKQGNVFIEDSRLIVHRSVNGVNGFDAVTGQLFSFKHSNNGHESFIIHPEGKIIVFEGNENECFYVGKNSEGIISLSFEESCSANWKDESEILWVRMILPEEVDKNELFLQNGGEFEIVAYNTQTKNEEVVFRSVESSSGKRNTENSEFSSEDIDENLAYGLMHKFSVDMTDSWLNLKRVDMSSYMEENIPNHLVQRWIDFDIKDRIKNQWKRLKSIDKIEITKKTFEKFDADLAFYEVFVDIKYTREEPSVNGIGLDVACKIQKIDGVWKILSMEITGPSVYREWKEKGCRTIDEVDKFYIESCKEHGIWNE